MPNIVFRCAYCNQLMKIGSRKTGTVVTCPKCANQIVVPSPENGQEDSERDNPADAQAGPGAIFEHGDFEKVLNEGGIAEPQMFQPRTLSDAPAPTSRLSSSAGVPAYEAVPLGADKTRPRGVFLTSGILAVITALLIVLMGMAFFLGFLVGRSANS